MDKYHDSVKRLSRIVLLVALAIVLRLAFGAFPNIKPLTAIFLVALSYMGLMDAWLVMALTMVGSGFLFGFGPVVLWQVVSFGLIQLIWWGLVRPFMHKDRFTIWLQSLLAAVLVYVYGFVISILSAWQFGIAPFIFWLNGLFFDSLHAVSTFLFYPIIYHIFRRFYK
ncbi:ECF transporter S component [Streptococcus suis]|uniref:ECF transporter S component n=1 Tax=Streptococcus suis TaxID=1307 RepID=UPI000CF52C36|nr:ECF transporter S component [Streptococcus suis]